MPHDLITDERRFHLDAYCARIGYDGPREPTMQVLRELQVRHALSIPFENLNPLLGWPVRLDTASLVQKLVDDRRGGYCFEQNLLFAHALHAIGFRFRGLSARVVYNAPPGTIRARTHMLVAIEVEDATILSDVGFGGLTATGPLVLAPGVDQATPHEPFRLVVDGECWQMEARVQDAWTPLYRFTLDTAYLPDYEMASWYLCHAPGSHFRTNLIVARPDHDRRHTLRDNVYTIHYLSGPSERQVLTGADAIRATLEGAMRLAVPKAPELDAWLHRLSAIEAVT
jgi:N-hydroxyarylamine O-acetyltransferase